MPANGLSFRAAISSSQRLSACIARSRSEGICLAVAPSRRWLIRACIEHRALPYQLFVHGRALGKNQSVLRVRSLALAVLVQLEFPQTQISLLFIRGSRKPRKRDYVLDK